LLREIRRSLEYLPDGGLTAHRQPAAIATLAKFASTPDKAAHPRATPCRMRIDPCGCLSLDFSYRAKRRHLAMTGLRRYGEGAGCPQPDSLNRLDYARHHRQRIWYLVR
jgi:hypothetical protein